MYFVAFDELINKQKMHSLFSEANALTGAILNGYKLVFCTQAAIIKDESASVPVAIWNVSEKDEIALDKRYQGFPTFFEKELVEIEVDGKVVKAFTFVLKKSMANYKLPPINILDEITRGYVGFVLPISDICVALERTNKAIGNKKVFYWFGPKDKEKE